MMALSAGAVAGSMPERASDAVQWIVTLLVSQPLSPSVPLATAPLSDGAVLSTLIGLTVVDDELSALSTAVAVTDWSAASVETAVVPPPVQLLIPERASEHAMLMVTSPLFQPSPLGCGLRDALMVGLVLSSLTVTEPDPRLPRWSVAVAVFVSPAVLLVTESVAGVGPLPTPEPRSLADHVRSTLFLLQPAALAAGESAAVTTGPVLSRT